MSAARSIAKNTTVLFISQVITYLLGFFITIYMANYLGAEGLGTISYALALCGILIVFTQLGFPTLMVRDISRDNSLTNKYSSNITLLQIILSIFTFALFVLIVYIEHYPVNTANIIYLIGASFIINAFSGIYYSVFQAYEQMEYVSIASVFNSVIMFSGVLIAIYYQANIVVFAFLYLFSNSIILLYYIVLGSWRLYLPKFEFDFKFWRFLVKESLPFAISGIFAVVAFQIDQVFLSLISGNPAVGYYSASYRLMQALMFLPSVYATAILPVFSKFHVSSKDSLKFGYYKSFKYLTILGLPIAVGTTLLANNIILLIYKSNFAPSILILQILIWSIPIIFLNYILGSSIISINKQRETVKVLFVAMLLNIILNLIFIPTYSYIAASIITVLTELFAFIFYLRIMFIYGYKIRLNLIVKPIIASIIMALFIISVHINVILVIVISTMIYFGVLILLKEFSEEDINLFKHMIHR